MGAQPKPMIMALADFLRNKLPEMDNRVIAVSEVDPFDNSNKPRLPVATVGLLKEDANQPKSGGGQIQLDSDVLIEFMFEPVKYTGANDAKTPFYAFYDYETLRNTLLYHLYGWRTPCNGSISYKGLDVNSDSFAVCITFKFRVSENLGLPETPPDGTVALISRLCVPVPSACPELVEKSC